MRREVEVFRSAGGIEGDEFHWLRAVVLHRLENTTVEGMQSAIELLQWVLDCGLSLCDESDHPPKCLAMVGDIRQFAPFLLDRIRNRVCPKRKIPGVGPDAYEVALDLSPKLRQPVKSQNSLKENLTHGSFKTNVHAGDQNGRGPAAGNGFIDSRSRTGF